MKENLNIPETKQLYAFDLIYYPIDEKLESIGDVDIDSYKEIIDMRTNSISASEKMIILSFSQLNMTIDNFSPQSIEQITDSIAVELNYALSSAYELPDLKYLKQKIENYKDKISQFFGEMINKSLADEDKSMDLRASFTKIKEEIEKWSIIASYLSGISKNNHPTFVSQMTFNFDICKIDLFMKVLSIKHIDKYILFLKRSFAISMNTMPLFEFDYKINYLHDFHKNFKLEPKVFVIDEYIHITFNSLQQMGMTSDFPTFKKAIEGDNVVLNFITDETISKKIAMYEPGRIFYILQRDKNKLGLKSHFIFKVRMGNNEKVTLNDFLDSANTSFKRFLKDSKSPIDLSQSEQDGVINNAVAMKSAIFKDWMQKTTSLQCCRPSLLIDRY